MLHSIQKTFKESILEEHDNIDRYLAQIKGISNKDRIHIYRNNTFVSLKQVLVDTFPAVTELVSIEFMRYICHGFIKAHPPKNGALMFYGTDFPKFLGTVEAAQPYPYLKDVAQLEWILSEIYDAKDTSCLSKEDILPEKLETLLHTPLKLTPSTRLIQSSYPILDLWSVTKGQESTNIDIGKAQYVLAYRDNETLNTHPLELNEIEFTFLHCFSVHNTLEAAIEHTLERFDDIDFQGILSKVIHHKLLTKEIEND